MKSCHLKLLFITRKPFVLVNYCSFRLYHDVIHIVRWLWKSKKSSQTILNPYPCILELELDFSGNSWKRHSWKKNPSEIKKMDFGKTWERHLWIKNPDFYHGKPPWYFEIWFFWEFLKASFVEKNPIDIIQ